MIEVGTQAQLDEAIAKYPDEVITCVGTGSFIVRGLSRVEARESSRPGVRSNGRRTSWVPGLRCSGGVPL